MPRGAKRDLAMTKLLQNNGLLLDKRSFVSIEAHLYLHGIDKSLQRPRVFARYHEACCVCGAIALENDSELSRGHWHHTKKCDCVECSEVRCNPFLRNCHRHGTVGFKRVAPKLVEVTQ
jgi:hypothetical protein